MQRLAKASLVILLFAVGGCGSSLDNLSTAADQTRNASERIADNADVANANREAKILADAALMEEKARAPTEAEGSRPRYEIRKDNVGDSWTVYDTANGRAVKVETKTQAGLSHDEAAAALAKLAQQDKQQDQLFGRQRP
jgi:hypothetical protein